MQTMFSRRVGGGDFVTDHEHAKWADFAMDVDR